MSDGPASILMIDDDPYSVQRVADNLLDAGYLVTLFDLSDDLFEVLQDHQFDIIILDIMMKPNGFFSELETHGGFVTGQLLARDIRDRWPDQKIMALSLHQDAGIQEWFNNQDGMIFVEKGTVQPKKLTNLVGKMLRYEDEGWTMDGNALLDSIQVKPSIFGIGVDLKKAWKSVKKQ